MGAPRSNGLTLAALASLCALLAACSPDDLPASGGSVGAAPPSTTGPVAPLLGRAAALWAERFGDAAAQRVFGVAAAPDGGAVLTGRFAGRLDVGSATLNAAPGVAGSLFVARLDAAGVPLWARTLAGPPRPGEGHAVAFDRGGDLLLTGLDGATLDDPDRDPGAPHAALVKGFFLAKLDPQGRQLWRTSLSSAFGGFTLAVDGGGFPMVGSTTAAGPFLQMLDDTGAICWEQSFPESCANALGAVAAGSSGAVVITGTYACPIDFGGGPLHAPGKRNAFVAAFDGTGLHLWSRGLGAMGAQASGLGAAIDEHGNAFVTGSYAGSPLAGGAPLPEATAGVFVAAFGPKGEPLWSHGYPGASLGGAENVALDGAGHVFVAGQASAPLDLGGGALAGKGRGDAFLLGLTAASGTYATGLQLVAAVGGAVQDTSLGAGMDGSVVLGGSLAGSLDVLGATLSSAGSTDLLVTKLAP